MKILFSIILLIVNTVAFAQTDPSQVEMADQFRADGKIYVVVATVLLVMAGIVAFLVWLERRIAALEKRKPS